MQHTGPWPVGTPCWTDLVVSDLDRSRAFYSRVLGWDFTEPVAEMGNYCNALVDGKRVAGLTPPMGPAPDRYSWTVYLATEDARATDEKVRAGGGATLFEPMEVGPMGTMVIWSDPVGQTFGGWQSGSHTGFELIEDPGTPAWLDLATPDYDRACRFYADLFGYAYDEQDDYPGGRYAMFTPPGAERPAGGIGSHDPDAPWQAGWNVAFAVDDVDAAARLVSEVGGAVLAEPSEDQYGRTAPVRGPDGEPFTLYAGPAM